MWIIRGRGRAVGARRPGVGGRVRRGRGRAGAIRRPGRGVVCWGWACAQGRGRAGAAGRPPGSERAGRGWRRVSRSPSWDPALVPPHLPPPGASRGMGYRPLSAPGVLVPGTSRSRYNSFILTFWSRSCVPCTPAILPSLLGEPHAGTPG